MIFETERLIVRRMDKNDFSNLCKILQDKRVMYAYEHAFSDEEVWEWLNRQIERYNRWGFGLWALIEKSTGEFIGQAGLTVQDWRDKKTVEIGYLLCFDSWHKGYAIEAAKACKKYAFEELGVSEVSSIIRENNLPSRRVAERNGLTSDDRIVKHYYNMEMPHIVYTMKNPRQQEFVKVETEAQFRTFAALADTVYHEYYSSLLTVEQIDYMVDKFLSLPALHREANEENYSFYLTQEDGIFVGFVAVQPQGDKLFLSKLYLSKEYRGKGYGKKMMNFVFSKAKKDGFKSVYLTVNRYNAPSIKIYEKSGFNKISEKAADIGNGFIMDDYIMEKTV